MKIWIDLANSPHVPFFRALATEFINRDIEIVVTARDFAETVSLAKAAGFAPEVIGGHGGGKLTGKAGNLIQRGLALARWARGHDIDLALSHNSYSQILAARALSMASVTLMDYEHQPANHLAFRLASRVIVPLAFPPESLLRLGASPGKVRRYQGTKEDVYLATFKSDPDFSQELSKLGISSEDILVTVRPPAREALYHRFENELFDRLLERLASAPGVKVILLPRGDLHREAYESRATGNLVIPSTAMDGANLIAHSDLVVSAGGTMNREAAALGIPAVSIYQGQWAAIDEHLLTEGRLQRISTSDEIDNLPLQKKGFVSERRATQVTSEVVSFILEPFS